MAHVHVVIVGFSREDVKPKLLFDADGQGREVENINGYLAPAPDVFVTRRAKPLCAAAPMVRGCQPTDDGNLLMWEEEKDEFLRQEPAAEKWIRPFSMGAEYINGKSRYCLWLVDAKASDFDSMPLVRERVKAIREFRSRSSKAATRKKAETAWLFDEIRPPEGGRFLAIPSVSSGKRKYLPVGFVSNGMIPGNKLYFISNASLYTFGIISSESHSSWMRTVTGRLKSDYNYSNTIVYNNFIWPGAQSPADLATPVEELVSPGIRQHIETCAQAVLDARDAHPDATLADLYDPDKMPSDLRKAHHELDQAVEAAYGVDFNGDEEKIVAHLFKLYALATEGE